MRDCDLGGIAQMINLLRDLGANTSNYIMANIDQMFVTRTKAHNRYLFCPRREQLCPGFVSVKNVPTTEEECTEVTQGMDNHLENFVFVRNKTDTKYYQDLTQDTQVEDKDKEEYLFVDDNKKDETKWTSIPEYRDMVDDSQLELNKDNSGYGFIVDCLLYPTHVKDTVLKEQFLQVKAESFYHQPLGDFKEMRAVCRKKYFTVQSLQNTLLKQGHESELKQCIDYSDFQNVMNDHVFEYVVIKGVRNRCHQSKQKDMPSYMASVRKDELLQDNIDCNFIFSAVVFTKHKSFMTNFMRNRLTHVPDLMNLEHLGFINGSGFGVASNSFFKQILLVFSVKVNDRTHIEKIFKGKK